MTVTDTPTLSYTITRTISITIDDAADARDRGETCAEFAADLADMMPPGAWTVVDEQVTPA